MTLKTTQKKQRAQGKRLDNTEQSKVGTGGCPCCQRKVAVAQSKAGASSTFSRSKKLWMEFQLGRTKAKKKFMALIPN